jgi:hypothetical protein
LQEIEIFKIKIGELIYKGFSSKRDDITGKNGARSLQKKALLRAEVLKAI